MLFSGVLAFKPFEALDTLLESWKKENQALVETTQKKQADHYYSFCFKP